MKQHSVESVVYLVHETTWFELPLTSLQQTAQPVGKEGESRGKKAQKPHQKGMVGSVNKLTQI